MEISMKCGKRPAPLTNDRGIPVWFRHRGIPLQMENRSTGTTCGLMSNPVLAKDSNSHIKYPNRFKKRIQVRYKFENPFSSHDNRNRLQGDGTYFGQELGRYKSKDNVNLKNLEDIITWGKEKKEQLPITNSLYREDFLGQNTQLKADIGLSRNRRYAKHLPRPKEGLTPPSSNTIMWNPENKMAEKDYFQVLADSQPVIKRDPWFYSYQSHSFSELPKLERRRSRSLRKLPSY